MTSGILIIDDEPEIRRTLASMLEEEHFRVFTAADAIAGMEILSLETIALVVLDAFLPRMGGFEALEHIRREYAPVEVIMTSGHAGVDAAVRAVRLGAFDFIEKPFSRDRMLEACRSAIASAGHKADAASGSGKKAQEENRNAEKTMLGVSPEIEKIRALLIQAAKSDARILISGENGTGKELAARAIHRLSGRSQKPFVEVNCAAIPDTLIETELFGHEKGAFTDAYSGRKGRFELASGGTLFLDEIGDMSLAAQAKVLRVIQEQKIERVGGEKTIDVDVRILAATNQDLEREVEKGRFREDLYFRLNVIPIKIPALRDRKADIPLLLSHFLEQFSGKRLEIEEPAMALLLSHPWPGNIRELKNLAERLAILFPDGPVGKKAMMELLNITAENAATPCPSDSPERSTAEELPAPFIKEFLETSISLATEKFEKRYLEFHLSRNGGILSKTAEAIGIYPGSLRAKLRKHGIKFSSGSAKE